MKNLTIVSLKVMAVYFFVSFIRRGLLSGIYLIFTNQMPILSKISFILSELIFLIIIYILWFKAEYVAGKITENLSIENVIAKELDYKLLLQTSLSLLGVIILAVSIPEFIRYIFEIFSVNNISIFKETPRFLAKILEIIIGFYLIYKSQSISNLIFKK